MSSVGEISMAEWIAQEPYTLAMSSGFFGFYAHAGVISALCDRHLEPAATRGSSAGAVATAMWASGIEPEQLATIIADLDRADFWDPSLGYGLLKGEKLDEKLRELLPIEKIEEGRVPIHISVLDVRSRQTQVLESGDLSLAVRASCAFPGLFQPVKIDGRTKLDGGIKDHAGYYGAPAHERILHHNLRPRANSRQTRPTDGRTNLASLELRDLPFVNPFGLHKGLEAYKTARAQTFIALDQPIKRR